MSNTSGDDLFADFFVGMVTIIGAKKFGSCEDELENLRVELSVAENRVDRLGEELDNCRDTKQNVVLENAELEIENERLEKELERIESLYSDLKTLRTTDQNPSLSQLKTAVHQTNTTRYKYSSEQFFKQ